MDRRRGRQGRTQGCRPAGWNNQKTNPGRHLQGDLWPGGSGNAMRDLQSFEIQPTRTKATQDPIEKPDGLKRDELTDKEWKQLIEANVLVDFSAEAVLATIKADKAYWVENPDHDKKLDIWKTTSFRKLLQSKGLKRFNFDQLDWGQKSPNPPASSRRISTWNISKGFVAITLCKSGRKPMERNTRRLTNPWFELLRAMARVQRIPRIHNLHGNKSDERPASQHKRAVEGAVGPSLVDQVQKDRDLENRRAIGGMRNPSESVSKLKGYAQAGKVVFDLLWKASDHLSVTSQVRSMLGGVPAEPIETGLVNCLRRLIVSLTPKGVTELPAKTAKASSPISPEIISAWGIL